MCHKFSLIYKIYKDYALYNMAKIQINLRNSLLWEDFFNHGAIIIVAIPYYFSININYFCIVYNIRFTLISN